jgi:hypothetical protein
VQLDLAQARQERLTALAEKTALRAKRLWAQRMGRDFDTSWARLGPEVSAITATAQVSAAAGASTYLATTARADDITARSGGTVQAASYGGVDASGRDLEGLLYGAVTAAKIVIGAGSGLQGAFQAGGTFLAVMARTAVLDTGRSADLTAMTAQSYTHYVRVVSPGACSRCAILAGYSSASRAFKRHPGCRCTAAPVTEEDKTLMSSGRFDSPSAYFEAMGRAEQDRVFTKAGAEAIRAGADPIAVVSARRGATKAYSNSDAVGSIRQARLQRTIIGRGRDGQPILGYTTGEGTTVRGDFAKRQRVIGGQFEKVGDSRYRTTKRVRLMPETLIGLTDDVELRQVLLRDAGYLRPTPTRVEMTSALGGTYSKRVAEQIRSDRAIADAFYREHGIHLG